MASCPEFVLICQLSTWSVPLWIVLGSFSHCISGLHSSTMLWTYFQLWASLLVETGHTQVVQWTPHFLLPTFFLDYQFQVTPLRSNLLNLEIPWITLSTSPPHRSSHILSIWLQNDFLFQNSPLCLCCHHYTSWSNDPSKFLQLLSNSSPCFYSFYPLTLSIMEREYFQLGNFQWFPMAFMMKPKSLICTQSPS